MNQKENKLKGEIVEIDPVLVVSLPNRPSWQESELDYSDYIYSLGRDIIDTNIIELREQNLKIDPTKAPDMAQEILGLSTEEKELIFKEGLDENQIKERFLVTKFVSDFLNEHIRKEAVERLIRQNSPDYGDRNMLEMIGDGDGVKLVGMTWELHKRDFTSR